MELKRHGWLVRWTYFLRTPPKRTSLCAFFWQCFVFVPLFGISLVGLVGFALYKFFTNLTTAGPFALLGIAFSSLVVWLTIRQEKRSALAEAAKLDRWNRGIPDPPTRLDKFFQSRFMVAFDHGITVFIDGLIAIKGKVCPVITIR